METDYRALLVKYMAHVKTENSVTFVDNVNYLHVYIAGERITFSEEEEKELQQIEKEISRK